MVTQQKINLKKNNKSIVIIVRIDLPCLCFLPTKTMKLKNYLHLLIVGTVLLVCGASKKKSSKLKLLVEHKYDGTNFSVITH